MNEAPCLLFAELFTDRDGRARFRDKRVDLREGNALVALSALQDGAGHQFRISPLGFRSPFHCTAHPQWLIVLQGAIEIGLQDKSSRVFQRGDALFANDTLPSAAVFDASIHGHWSRQVGDQPLVTLFVRV